MTRKTSTYTFVALILIYAALAAVSVFLPQGLGGMPIQQMQLPAPIQVVALVAGLGVLVAYGLVGAIGLFLSRKLALPEIWEPAISNRRRFIVPALIGLCVGLVVIVLDLLFSPLNGIGRIPHPPFPTSIVAALAAGIGEEVLFRLFFISFWTWLVSRVILRGRGRDQAFWVVSVISAVVFALSHMPAVMYVENWSSFAQVPAALIAEIVLMNGVLGLAAAFCFKKYGFLAPVGVHFWADVVWHVVWAAL